MLRVFLVLAFVLFPTYTFAIDNVGIAPYAIQKKDFPCRALLRSLKGIDNVHIAYLHRTFGLNNRCLKKVFKNENLRSVEVHVMNEVCVRNGNCGPYETLAGINKRNLDRELKSNRRLWRRIKKHAFEVRRFLDAELPEGVQCYISPLLETHYVKHSTAKKVFRKFRKWFPDCIMVWSPIYASMPEGADLIETHGRNTLACRYCIANLDGDDISFPDRPSFFPSKDVINYQHIPGYITRNKSNVMTFLWTAECNCIGRYFQDPRKRRCQNNGVYRKMARFIRRAQENNP